MKKSVIAFALTVVFTVMGTLQADATGLRTFKPSVDKTVATGLQVGKPSVDKTVATGLQVGKPSVDKTVGTGAFDTKTQWWCDVADWFIRNK